MIGNPDKLGDHLGGFIFVEQTEPHGHCGEYGWLHPTGLLSFVGERKAISCFGRASQNDFCMTSVVVRSNAPWSSLVSVSLPASRARFVRARNLASRA